MINLAILLRTDEQLDAAEEAASNAIDILPEKGRELQVCEGHRALGSIYHQKDKTEKAIHHFEIALAIASSLGCRPELIRIHISLADLFFEECRLDDAHAHVEQAKSRAVNDPYLLAHASQLQDMLEEAKSETLRALDTFEKFGAAIDVENTREFLDEIDRTARGNGLGSSHT